MHKECGAVCAERAHSCVNNVKLCGAISAPTPVQRMWNCAPNALIHAQRNKECGTVWRVKRAHFCTMNVETCAPSALIRVQTMWNSVVRHARVIHIIARHFGSGNASSLVRNMSIEANVRSSE